MAKDSRPTVLLTSGRIPPAIDLARSFAAAGWRVLVAESLPLHLALTSRAVARCYRVPAPPGSPAEYLTALARIVEQETVSLVVPVSEETPYVVSLGEVLPTPIFGLPQAHVLALQSKVTFIERAAALGLAVPVTARAGSEEAAAISAAGPHVVKPEFGCGGKAVRFQPAGEDTGQHGDVIQARVQGEEVSAFAVARAGSMCAFVCYHGSVRHGTSAVAFERIEHTAVRQWVEDFVAGTGHHGFIAFDFILTEAGDVFAIECNPRITSGVHFLQTEALAPLLLHGEPAPYSEARQLQEFWSCWTHWFASLRQPEERRRTGSALRHARDVSWRRDDPFVFLLATFSCAPILWRAARAGVSFGEVVMQDVQWQPIRS
ncbi:MAG: ATP-grasp domain-containing protein [Pseudomonadota bacterium]